MQLFTEFKSKELTIKNRVVMPPMCMFSAGSDGKVNDFHQVHYATRAAGGTGLIILEATGVSPEGRISARDLGIWDDVQIEGLKSIVELCKPYGTKMAIQLGHAGRKSNAGADLILAPSALPFDENSRTPQEMSHEDIANVAQQFRDAAARADKAGFDAIEIHGAHGYLISEFLSPLTNRREDEYGGSTANRARFLKMILQQIHTVWPDHKPVILRVSAHDYSDGGMTPDQMTGIIREVRDLIDLLHVSSGGVVPVQPKAYPGYQIPFAEKLRKECGIPTIAVGLVTDSAMAEEILSNERADLVALGRELLRNPYWVLAVQAGDKQKESLEFPAQYKRAFL